MAMYIINSAMLHYTIYLRKRIARKEIGIIPYRDWTLTCLHYFWINARRCSSSSSFKKIKKQVAVKHHSVVIRNSSNHQMNKSKYLINNLFHSFFKECLEIWYDCFLKCFLFENKSKYIILKKLFLISTY